MSGAGKMGDRGGGRESTKSLNKSKQTKHKIEVDQKKSREQYLLTRPKYSPSAPHLTMPAEEDRVQPMIDASCHLLSRSFSRDLIAVMRRAKETGVVGCVLQCDWTRTGELMSLVKQWPGQLFATVGVSPDIIKLKGNDKLHESRMDALLDFALQPEVVAISCGLDLTRDMGTHFLQAKLFGAQVALARQVKLPVIVWEKAACEQVVQQLQELKTSDATTSVGAAASTPSSHPHGKPDPIVINTASASATPFPRIAIHNFNGTASDLERYLKADCFLTINGLVCDVKTVGEAASSTTASKDEQQAKKKRDDEAKAAEAENKNDDAGEEEHEHEEEEHHTEESEGTGFQAQTLVGPPDLTGSGAHLFHLIRSGLLPIDRLLISTDAPLHTPQNIGDFFIRTSRNEPSNMPYIFQQLAKAYSLPVEVVQQKVFATSKAFFNLLNPSEAAAEEEGLHEKERQKQAEEKKLVDKERRAEAEAKKKAEREKQEKEDAAAGGAAEKEQGKKGGKKAQKGGGGKDKDSEKPEKEQPKSATASANVSEDEDDGGRKKKGGKSKGGKAGAAPAAAAGKKSNAAAAAAADDSDDSDGGWGKTAAKNKKQVKKQAAKQKAQAQKKNKNAAESEEEEDEEEEEDAPAAVVKTKKEKEKEKVAAAKKAATSKPADSDEESSEDDEPAAKPSKKSAPAAAKKPSKKESEEESSSESESDDEEAPKKKPAASAPAKSKSKKSVESSESESSESDSDSDGGKKQSTGTISAAKRARAAAIKEKQVATKLARNRGDTSGAGGAKKKGGKGAKEEEAVDELDELFMASTIDGLDAAAAEQKKQLDAAKKKSAASASQKAAQPDDREDEVVQFRCRKCQAKLFQNSDEVGHDDRVAAQTAQQRDYSACEQLFIERPSWLAEDTLDEAKSTGGAVDILCFKCNAKLGRVSTSAPLLCACGRPGAGSSPWVAMKLSRLDAVTTASASIKGPREVDADELDKVRADEEENYERLRQKEKERLKAKDKEKKASLMPVAHSVGNFNQFRNKNTNIEHRASADKAPLKVAGGKAKQKRDKNAAKDEESD